VLAGLDRSSVEVCAAGFATARDAHWTNAAAKAAETTLTLHDHDMYDSHYRAQMPDGGGSLTA
jgi:hypothetical protein